MKTRRPAMMIGQARESTVEVLVPEAHVVLWVQNGGRLLRRAAPEDGTTVTPVLLSQSRKAFAAGVQLIERGVAAVTAEVLGCEHGRRVGQPCPHCLGLSSMPPPETSSGVSSAFAAKPRRRRGV